MNSATEYERLFDQGGHVNEEGVAYYAEAILAGREDTLPEGLRAHVAHCSHCAAQCLEMVMILKEIDAGEASAGEGLTEGEQILGESCIEMTQSQSGRIRLVWRRYRIVAGFLLLGSIGLFLLLWLSEMKREEDLVKKHDRGVIRQEQRVLETWVSYWAGKNSGFGERFILNPSLEKMLAMAFRSGEFAVLSPDSLAVYHEGDTVFFNWKGAGMATLVLRVIGNTGETLHQRKLSHHHAYYLPVRPQPGLYYWFVELDGMKAAGGRFIINRGDEGMQH
ncbi:MAG TPA: hypothetical protein P5531_09020 [Bacteroidales bacterium]|nr:hypothetical protein [Bacteroidales bacterium]HSA44769.1 hypothetical protein [Bacteroidales bacterium]